MQARSIMLQGTASSVGKSLLAAALCRILKQDGYRVAPFKAQNMALNSYVTADGLEMGRAQAMQAEACGLPPRVEMNPVLLKPMSERNAQVIVMGKALGDMNARQYQEYKPELRETVREAYLSLAREHQVVVLEGAGSPAEINLQEDDLVNMGMAAMAASPVLLVGDIDRGGVFASLAGTMLLLSEEDKRRVRGVIINKFRGDVEILKPGLGQLEEITGVPVLGVIPWLETRLDDEDSLTARFRRRDRRPGGLNVAVLKLPHMANFTDFNALEYEPDVCLYYVREPGELEEPDLIIIPGSKSTVHDLKFLRDSGLEERVKELHRKGTPLIGICGGFQMLGREILDPDHVESPLERVEGMGLLDMVTVFQGEKVTAQTEGAVAGGVGGMLAGLEGMRVRGYEIHMGVSRCGAASRPLLYVAGGQRRPEGLCDPGGTVFGTYLHGIFDQGPFLRGLLNNLRGKKGLPPLAPASLSYGEFKEQEYDRLAAHVRAHLDMPRVYDIIFSG